MSTKGNIASPTTTDVPYPRSVVIGAGAWGRNLIRNLNDLGILAGIAESNPENRRRAIEDHPDLPVTVDHREWLDSDVPVCFVATPVATHFQVVRAFLEAGKHVFVEKPLTLDRDEARALADLAEERGLILMVGHLLLFQPAIEWLRNFLAEGGIGTVRSIHQERLGLGRVRDYENALWCLGSHDVAVQRFLVDREPVRIQVEGQSVLQPGIEDDVYLHVEYDDGLQTHLHCSWLWPEKRRTLVVLGTEGMVEYDEIQQVVVLHRKGVNKQLEVTDAGSETLYNGHGQPLRLEIEHFLNGVVNGGTVRSDGHFAAEVVRLLATATDRLRGKKPHPAEGLP